MAPPLKAQNLIQIKPTFSMNTPYNKNKLLIIAHQNVRSAREKAEEIKQEIMDQRIDILALSETWFHPDESAMVLKTFLPDGYDIKHCARTQGRGGGLAMIYRENLSATVQTIPKPKTFECMQINFSVDNRTVKMIAIYRPPTSSKSEFVEEFSDLCEKENISGGEVVMLGDFNIHVDESSSAVTRSFNTCLEMCSLKQHVELETHKHGHTLDLLITRPGQLLISNTRLSHTVNSDHAMVICDTNLTKPPSIQKVISSRKWKAVNIEQFQSDISENLQITDEMNADEAVEHYNCVLTDLANKHAPVTEKRVTVRPITRWMTPEIIQEKTARRKLEPILRATTREFADASQSEPLHPICDFSR